MTHDEIKADLSAFALGALDAPERAEIERHLAGGCVECTRELVAWEEVVGTLALAGQADAAPDLKPALLRRVRRVPGTERGKVLQFPRWLLVPMAAAAGALLVLGVVRETRNQSALNAQAQLLAAVRGELGSTQDRLAAAQQQLAALEQDRGALRTALAAAHDALAVLQAPGLRMVQLSQTPDAAPAGGHMLISPRSGRALFYAFDLAPLPQGKTYELWWITEKAGPVNAGLFQLDPSGTGRVDTALPADAGTIKAAAVTVEPAGGVDKPTGPMVLFGAA